MFKRLNIGLALSSIMLSACATISPKEQILTITSEAGHCTEQVLQYESAILKKKFWPIYATEFDVEDPVYVYAYFNGITLSQLFVYPTKDDFKTLSPGRAQGWHEVRKNKFTYMFDCTDNDTPYRAYEQSTPIGAI